MRSEGEIAHPSISASRFLQSSTSTNFSFSESISFENDRCLIDTVVSHILEHSDSKAGGGRDRQGNLLSFSPDPTRLPNSIVSSQTQEVMMVLEERRSMRDSDKSCRSQQVRLADLTRWNDGE